MSVLMVPVAAIVPNRYRHIEAYKLSESKLEALRQSYDTSGFWDGSIQARPHPTKQGKYEIAFGHHRVEAAKRAKIHEIGLVVANRSDADMLRMMADENREEFRSDALVAVETIAAVVDAYERGEIELEEATEQKSQKFILPGGKYYSLATVARFLGWVKPSDGQATSACRSAFDAYRMRASTQEALATIPSQDRSQVAVDTVTSAARTARTQALRAGLSAAKVQEAEKIAARTAAKEVKESSGFKARTVATQIGKQAVSSVAGKKAKTIPPVEHWTAKLIDRCEQAEPYAEILTDCRRLIPFIDDLNPTLAHKLASALEAMLARSSVGVTAVVKALRSGNTKRVVALLEKGA